MYEKIIKFRGWLERNKIFFDIIAVLFLTLMSITVSISQNNLMKEENQPIFTFSFIDDYKGNNDTENVVEALDIYNMGKPIFNFNANAETFLSIQFYDYNNSTTKNVYVPIHYYGDTINKTNSPTGYLVTLGRPNWDEIAPASDFVTEDNARYGGYSTTTLLNYINADLSDYVGDQINCEYFVNLYTYIYITYSDIYGEKHNEVYYVNSGDIFKLSEKDQKIVAKIPSYYGIPYSSCFIYIPPTEIIRMFSNGSPVDYDLPGGNFM